MVGWHGKLVGSESRQVGRGCFVDSFPLGGVTCVIKVGDKVEDRSRARRMGEGESWRASRQGAESTWVKTVARLWKKTDVMRVQQQDSGTGTGIGRVHHSQTGETGGWSLHRWWENRQQAS